MRRALHFLLWSLAGILVLAGVLGALFGYLIYSPRGEAPQLTGTLTHGTIAVGGRTRTYLIYDLRAASPAPVAYAPDSPDIAKSP